MKKAVSLICSNSMSQNTIDSLASIFDYIHFDIMDKSMTTCVGLDFEDFILIKDEYRKKVEVHIMSTQPDYLIKKCVKYSVGTISFHIESECNIEEKINEIKNENIKAGLVISPSTPIEKLIPFLPIVDYVTVLTVEPGPAGQKFQRRELNKVVLLGQYREKYGYHFEIEVDGAINQSTYPDIVKSGADVSVFGKSGFFSLSDDLNQAHIVLDEYTKQNGIVYLHADLVGNSLKEYVKECIAKYGYKIIDLYTDGTAEYPECAKELTQHVKQSRLNFGVLFCGTGIGMSMVANRFPGIRAAVVSDVYTSKMSREHNDANVLCLGSRVTTKEEALLIIDAFFQTKFLFGKHSPRVERFDQNEER